MGEHLSSSVPGSTLPGPSKSLHTDPRGRYIQERAWCPGHSAHGVSQDSGAKQDNKEERPLLDAALERAGTSGLLSLQNWVEQSKLTDGQE